MEKRPSIFGMSIEDYGADKNSPLGFTFEKGNKALSEKEQEFFRRLVVSEYAHSDDLIRTIEQRKSWQILDHVNRLGLEFMGIPTIDDRGRTSGKAGEEGIQKLTELAVNIAFYSGGGTGNPAYAFQNLVLLRQAKDKNSVISDIMTPQLYQRLMNASFWERPNLHDRKDVSLEEQVLFLNPSFASEGLKLFERSCCQNASGYSYTHRMDFDKASLNTIRMYGQFINDVLSGGYLDNLNFKQTLNFVNSFVSPYLEKVELKSVSPKIKETLKYKVANISDALPFCNRY